MVEFYEIISSIISSIILFGSGLSLLIGIEQLTGRKNLTRVNILLSIVSFFVAIILWNYSAIYSEAPLKNSWMIFLIMTSLYVIGPLNYLYYRSLLKSVETKSLKNFLHLLPPFLILIFETGFHLSDATFKREIIHSFLQDKVIGILGVGLLAGLVIFVLYQLYFTWLCIQLWEEKRIKAGVRIAFGLQVYNMLSIIPVGIWVFTKHKELMLISGFMTTSVMVFVFLFNNRYPDLFSMLKRNLIKKKYERSFLQGIDTDLLKSRLVDLMENGQIYHDFDLTLQSLAEKLSLTSHQLSQFLNEQMEKSFKHYINGYRIDEAKELLVNEPKIGIIHICYQVGFSSKSTFNNAFKDQTEVTPTEFRTINCK